MEHNTIANIILLIIIIVIVITVTIAFLSNKCSEIPDTMLTFNDIKHMMKTGDIILLNGAKYIRSNIIRAVTNSPITHSLMIIRDGNELNAIDISPFRTKDVKIRPLKDIFNEDLHPTQCWIPYDADINITNEDIQRYKQINYNYSPMKLYNSSESNMICPAFVAYIHKDKGFNPGGLSDTSRWWAKSIKDYYHDNRTIHFNIIRS